MGGSVGLGGMRHMMPMNPFGGIVIRGGGPGGMNE